MYYYRLSKIKALLGLEIEDVSRKILIPEIDDIHEAHQAGESILSLSLRYGYGRNVICGAFARAGWMTRSMSEAGKIRAERIGPQGRAALTADANRTRRGQKDSFTTLCQRAVFWERNPPDLTSCELYLAEHFRDVNLPFARHRACGPYNIDFTVGESIAVECFGGGWHAGGRAAARHHPRVRYLLDAGFHVIVVWVQKRSRRNWIAALDQTIGELKTSCSDPSTLRQYRVIWRDTKPISRNANDDDFPLKPSFCAGRDAAGRYNSVTC